MKTVSDFQDSCRLSGQFQTVKTVVNFKKGVIVNKMREKKYAHFANNVNSFDNVNTVHNVHNDDTDNNVYDVHYIIDNHNVHNVKKFHEAHNVHNVHVNRVAPRPWFCLTGKAMERSKFIFFTFSKNGQGPPHICRIIGTRFP